MRILFLISSFLISFLGFGQDFSELIKVVASDRGLSDNFGYSVDVSGNYAIVGAYSDDFGTSNPNMGSAYIFEKEGIADWELVQKINNSDQDDYDRFGWSVAIDGNRIVVGAYAEDHDEFDSGILSRAGSAYVFERNLSGVWNQTQKIVASDRDIDDEFGWSVDISGTTIAIGAHQENHDEDGLNFIYHSGSVYLFDLSGGTWSQTQKIVASDRSADIDFPDGASGEDVSDLFGGDLSLSEDYLIVGAHHHDYDASGGAPLNEAGAAYIFERTGSTWTEVEKLQNSDRATEDRFGFSVAISGNYALVGAHTEDHNLTGGGTLNNAGSVYAFERNLAGNWNQIQKVLPDDRHTGDRFGWDIAMDDTLAIIGAYRANTDEFNTASLSDAGAAYVFYYNTTDDWMQLNKLDASDRKAEDELGVSVSISGNEILIGAYQQSFNVSGTDELSEAGAAYFYGQEECVSSSSAQTLTLCSGQSVIVGPFEHTTTGIYTDILFSESGCDSTVTTNLTIIPPPTSSQEIERCFGHPFTIGSSSHTESGVYSDTITAISGCDSIVITTLTFSPENSIIQDKAICWGETYTIGSSTYSFPGTYTDVITSSTLCDCTITTNLTVQLPIDNSISQDLNLLKAGAVDASYQWIKCDPFQEIIGTGANEQTYLAPLEGAYAVIVTDGACVDTSSCVLVTTLETAEETFDQLFNVYPNPNKGDFTLVYKLNDIPDFNAVLRNSVGQIVHEENINSYANHINVNNLPKGVYVLSVRNLESVRVKRLVIN